MAKKVKKAEEMEINEANSVFEEQSLPPQTEDGAGPDWQQIAAAVEELRRQKEESEQKYLRLLADFDNFRKRSRQEREDTVRFANSELLTALLPIADNLERAAVSAQTKDGNFQALSDGVKMISKQLMAVFNSVGVEQIEAAGADFDPLLHEAFAQEEAGEEQKGKVLLDIRKGYLLHGKLLRPSMVKVGC
ncbi:MAG: nucleotide exchange factor GrpE [Clostridiales bacterium]|nr:nucleotide exchange factor GrpE [Clostridiales bacterium]